MDDMRVSPATKVVVRLIIECGFYCVLNYTKPQKVGVRLLFGVRLVHGIIRYLPKHTRPRVYTRVLINASEFFLQLFFEDTIFFGLLHIVRLYPDSKMSKS